MSDPASYGLIRSVVQAGLGEKLVMACLATFSVVSWGVIGQKIRVLGAAQR
jgi:biopolymer transport protein ExbB/TolQ